MRYFPAFFDLKGRRVTVVGGGEEALRKIRLLLKTEASIEVVASDIHPELCAEARVRWVATSYSKQLLVGSALVFSADADLNEQVSTDAKALGIPVNAVDAADISSFIVPSIVDRDPVVVAIGTEGAAPVLAQGIRARIDALLPAKLGQLASRAAALRDHVAAVVPHGNRRRAFWQDFFFGAMSDAFTNGDKTGFAQAFKASVTKSQAGVTGRVSLVGAGPGDAELLTLKAQRKLMEADVIVYDRLVSREVLEVARRDAVRIAVGKTPFAPSPSQQDITDILLREARKGLRVVRLKGGDPYVFGRGGEEQAALEAAGIPVDIVPGITAAIGCAASARLPLTQRGINRSVRLITATTDAGLTEIDWAAVAAPGEVTAIYMGIHAAGEIASSLLAAGVCQTTPVAVIENGTRTDERIFQTTVGNLWETIQHAGISGPALIYLGLAAPHANTTSQQTETGARRSRAALRVAT